MKFSKITKSLVAGSVLAGASLSANAGVVATSYLDVQSFGIVAYFDAGLTDQVSNEQLAQFITVSSGQRSSSTSTGFNGVGLPDTPVFAPTNDGIADGVFNCAGPSCGLTGVSNNSLVGNYSAALNLHNDSRDNNYGYGMADAIVSGSALNFDPTNPASGMTYAAASVGGNGSVGSGNSDIADSLTTVLNFELNGPTEIYLAFTLAYKLIVDTVQSADIESDSSQVANATASASFQVGIGSDDSTGNGGALGVQRVLDGGTVVYLNEDDLEIVSLVSEGDDFTGSDTGVMESNGSAQSEFFRLRAGDFQVSIGQESTARASLVSAPGTLAIAGLGLLGLAAVRRRKS